VKTLRISSSILVVAILLAACSTSSKESFDYAKFSAIGESEKSLNLVALDGYVQNGDDDIKTNWVENFETETKCSVNIYNAKSETDIVKRVETGKVDGLLARTNVVGELSSKGSVAPINTALIAKYPQIPERLKGQSFNTIENQTYSLPVSFGFQVLSYNNEKIEPTDSWKPFFKPEKIAKNKISVDRSLITFAQAALFLKTENPKLGIKNPFALSQDQFTEVVNLLEKQKSNGTNYFGDQISLSNSLASRESLLGNTDLNYSYALRSENVSVNFTIPKEGTVGWVDAWAISANALNPNCMYKWLNHVSSSEIDAKYAQFIGAAPANIESCSFTSKTNHCKLYFSTDNSILDRVTFWTNPTKTCLDGRTKDECKTYEEYKTAWNKIIEPS